MNIGVWTPTGRAVPLRFTVDAPEIMVEEVKRRIFEIEGVPTALQQLFFDGRQLQDGRTLADYNIRNRSFLDLSAYPKLLVIRSPGKLQDALTSDSKVWPRFRKETNDFELRVGAETGLRLVGKGADLAVCVIAMPINACAYSVPQCLLIRIAFGPEYPWYRFHFFFQK